MLFYWGKKSSYLHSPLHHLPIPGTHYVPWLCDNWDYLQELLLAVDSCAWVMNSFYFSILWRLRKLYRGLLVPIHNSLSYSMNQFNQKTSLVYYFNNPGNSFQWIPQPVTVVDLLQCRLVSLLLSAFLFQLRTELPSGNRFVSSIICSCCFILR